MFGSEVLNVAIGLIFVYLVLSLFVTVLNEGISTLFNMRGNNLVFALKQMLGSDNLKNDQGESLGKRFMQHGMFQMLGRGKKNPSYMDSDTFSIILLNLLKGKRDAKNSFDAIKQEIDALPDGKTKATLQTLIEDSEEDVETFRVKAEAWFDSMMDRAAGWYSKRLKKITAVVSFVLVVAVNADTIHIVEVLAMDDAARDDLVQMATSFKEKVEEQGLFNRSIESYQINGSGASLNDSTKQVAAGLQGRDLTTNEEQYLKRVKEHTQQLDSIARMANAIQNVTGMGWNQESVDCSCEEGWSWFMCLVIRFFGWVLTTIAITLGAPFWFDLLKKLINIRGSGGAKKAKDTTA